MERIKLVWDFRGMEAKHFADHHAIHLKEFAQAENLENTETGSTEVNEMHWYAYLIVLKSDMIFVRDRLKPHRGLKV